MRLLRLEDLEEKKPFDCGDAELNGFFYHDAADFSREMLANTFVLEDGLVTVAYFSLLNDKISSEMADRNLWRKLRKSFSHRKHLGSYPAVKIGRLAVSEAYMGHGIGSEIISTIKQMLISDCRASACRFLTLDAYRRAVPFYEKNGFRPLVMEASEDNVPMYYDLKELKMQ